jgi:hypothetical protein
MLRSVTFVFPRQGQEQSLNTIFVGHNPEAKNRWQFSAEERWIIGLAESEQKNTLFPPVNQVSCEQSSGL